MRLLTVLTGRGPRACEEFEGSYVELVDVDPGLPATVTGLGTQDLGLGTRDSGLGTRDSIP